MAESTGKLMRAGFNLKKRIISALVSVGFSYEEAEIETKKWLDYLLKGG